MSYFIKLIKILVKLNNVNYYTEIGPCLHGVDAYYGVTHFNHSMGVVACYILYVLNFHN